MSFTPYPMPLDSYVPWAGMSCSFPMYLYKWMRVLKSTRIRRTFIKQLSGFFKNILTTGMMQCTKLQDYIYFNTMLVEKNAQLYRPDAQVDLSVRWSYKSYCRFCRALAQILILISVNGNSLICFQNNLPLLYQSCFPVTYWCPGHITLGWMEIIYMWITLHNSSSVCVSFLWYAGVYT